MNGGTTLLLGTAGGFATYISGNFISRIVHTCSAKVLAVETPSGSKGIENEQAETGREDHRHIPLMERAIQEIKRAADTAIGT